MKLLIKSLSILAIGGIFAGTGLAGPGDAYLDSLGQRRESQRREKNRIRHHRSVSSRSDTCLERKPRRKKDPDSQRQVRRVSATITPMIPQGIEDTFANHGSRKGGL